MDKKILFTLLSVQVSNRDSLYVNSCKRLIQEILTQTIHDVFVTTNDVSLFSEYLEIPRVTVRSLPEPDLMVSYEVNGGYEFNYNLKHVCFKDIPVEYKYIVYLDADIRIAGWNEESDNYLDRFFSGDNEVGATRTNAIFEAELGYYREGGGLFGHKFSIYDLDDILSLGDNIKDSKLPSEHFLIFKNIPEKINKFYETWRYLNKKLQDYKGGQGSFCDAFEIGISFQAANLKVEEITHGDSLLILKFYFNGNKYL